MQTVKSKSVTGVAANTATAPGVNPDGTIAIENHLRNGWRPNSQTVDDLLFSLPFFRSDAGRMAHRVRPVPVGSRDRVTR